MSYVPTEWATGDVVTAAKLNKLEEAVANAVGVLMCNFADVDETITCDKTLTEINTAVQAGQIVRGAYNHGTLTYYLNLMFTTPEEPEACEFVGFYFDDQDNFAILELSYSDEVIIASAHPFA